MRQEYDHLMRCAVDPEIAAAIVMFRGGQTNLPALKTLLSSGKPVVLLGRDMDMDIGEANCDFVAPNDFDSAYRVVQHLLAQGHRNIAHVTNGEPASTVAERRKGYERALETAGIPVRPELIIPHGTDELGRIAFLPAQLKRLLSLPEPPTALFAVNDWVALTILMAAYFQGIRIPGDLAITGFDFIAQFREGSPLLTSAEQPFEEMGRHAVIMIQERLSGSVARVKRSLYLEAPLRVHESSNKGLGGADAASRLLVRESAWRTRLIYHYIRLHTADDLSLEDLAPVVGVSTRTLLDDFRQHEKTSPMQALHEERLDRVRWELQHTTESMTVAKIASYWGIKQLGRFSAQYHEKYGELPSDTLRHTLKKAGSPV